MGSLWRSEDMLLVQLAMPRSAVHDTVQNLGREEVIQFLDMYNKNEENSNVFQRSAANEVKKCEELQRKIRFFESELARTEGLSYSSLEPSEESLFEFDTTLDDLDERLSGHEAELLELNKRLDLLMKQKNSKNELKHVLLQGEQFFRAGSRDLMGLGSSSALISRSEDVNDGLHEEIGGGGLRFITGVIKRDKVQSFMMLCYRATRGLMIPRFVEIDEPLYDSTTQTFVPKNVFIIFFNADIIGVKIAKICETIGAHVHEIPETSLEDSKAQLETELEDHSYTIDQSNRRRLDLLSEISISLALWKMYVDKEKNIYHTMNKFKFMSRSAYAQGWIPAKYESRLQDILDSASASSRTDIISSFEVIPWKENQMPPTYFEETEFVRSFQMIIDAYGVPAYKEANPAVLSTILFPFIFAIMFGDYGHGFIMFLFGLTLCIFQSRLRRLAETNEMFGMIFQGRYIVLLMGLFSIYTGLLYNDIFALSLEFFGQSAYSFDEHTGLGSKVRRTYVFGVDPAWYGTMNKLSFYNSLKMKMSIIFGVGHMLIGLFLGLSNHIYHRHWSHIFFEFIPEVLILTCTFGYMGIMIIIKWCTNWIAENRQPPSILNTMTDFFLHPWGIQQDPLYSGQLFVQLTLLLITVICVPLMLFPLPIMKIINMKLKGKPKEHPLNAYEDDQAYMNDLSHLEHESSQNMPSVNPDSVDDEEEEEESASEVFIKQLIHTIEYVLGAVSNTASYLRLWALSLAHSQLSEVFWDMTMGLVLNQSSEGIFGILIVRSGIGFLIAYSVWFTATVGILLGMESLSAFLHTLRLVWVEHNNKFYAGTGIPFEPFSFKSAPVEEQ